MIEENWINIEGDLLEIKDSSASRDLNLMPIFLRDILNKNLSKT